MSASDNDDLAGAAGDRLGVRRLIGVYDADGTVFGELSYVARRALGRTHCALCDITHGTFRSRSEWDECRTSLGVPFDTYHRNDQPAEVIDATGGATPIVVAELRDSRMMVLLGEAQLDGCAKSPAKLMAAITEALAALQP